MGQTINQVRHLYVAKKIVELPTPIQNEGDLQLIKQGNTAYFKYMSPNNQVVVSDKFDLDKIEYAKVTRAADMTKKLKKHTITINEAAKGVEYIIRVTLKNYVGLGDNNMAFKYGMAVGTGDTGKLAEELAKSLIANSKDFTQLFNVTYSGSTITIKEVAQDWVRGKMAKEAIPFEVEFLPVLVEGVETNEWAEDVVTFDADNTIKNGYAIADLEYFCMGARGDYYRGMGYPNTIETKYLVDETKEYTVLDIHYSYTGANESVQKSEKDITIVTVSEDLDSLRDELTV